MNANILIKKLHDLLGKMNDKAVRYIVERLENAIGYLQERDACIVEEYKRLTGKKNLELSNESRKCLAQRARSLNDSLLSIIETGYTVNAIRLWYQKLIAEKYDRSGNVKNRRGPKPTSPEVVELVIQFAQENPEWGYRMIAEMLNNLGIPISHTTVEKILKDHGIFPKKRINADITKFYDAHQNVLAVCDFITYEMQTPTGLQRAHILFFENITTREVWCGGIKCAPRPEPAR